MVLGKTGLLLDSFLDDLESKREVIESHEEAGRAVLYVVHQNPRNGELLLELRLLVKGNLHFLLNLIQEQHFEQPLTAVLDLDAWPHI